MTPIKHTCTQGERILTLELNQKNMAVDVSEIKKDVKEINNKIDIMIENMEKKFVMRTEFKVAIGTLSTLAVVIGLITYFLDK